MPTLNMNDKRSIGKRLCATSIALVLIISLLPILPSRAHAAELPNNTQFATVEELRAFNTNDNDGVKNPAKVYFGNDEQQWWIAGSQNSSSMTLFVATMLTATTSPHVFQQNYTSDITYSDDWDCTYPDGAPTDVYPNHYGASPIRTTLHNLESSYFTSEERALMKDTTIYTNDTKNDTVYSITDKLYLAYGDYHSGNDQYITVGANSATSLNNGLRIDNDYWRVGIFWLRAPYPNYFYYALTAYRSNYVSDASVVSSQVLAPAFELDLASVSFASAAPAASSDGELTLQDTDGDGAFTLRYGGRDLGSVQIANDYLQVNVADVPADTYLVAQNKEGAWAKAVSGTTSVSAAEMGIDSFENCKVWLETTNSNERMTYATMATVQTDPQWEIGSPNASDVIATLHDDGSLVISGNGDVAFSTASAPWSPQAESIKTVTIEDGVEPSSMEDWFYGCTNLVSAPTIPSSVKNLSGTFARCTSLTTASAIPSSVTDLSRCFSGCTSLETLPMIPSGVTSLQEAFADCPAITAIPRGWEFPSNCSNIENCFLVSQNDALTTYCDKADYAYLSNAYDWKASNRMLVANPVDPADKDEENDNAAESTDTDDPSNDDEAGNLAYTGDQLLSSIVLLLLAAACFALFIANRMGRAAYLRQGKTRD